VKVDEVGARVCGGIRTQELKGLQGTGLRYRIPPVKVLRDIKDIGFTVLGYNELGLIALIR
jgi:hypothetical protein